MDTYTILSRQHMFTDARHALPLLLESFSFSVAPLRPGLFTLAAIIALSLYSIGRRLLLSSLTLTLQLCTLFALLHHSPEIALAHLASFLQRFEHMVANLVVQDMQLSSCRRVVWL